MAIVAMVVAAAARPAQVIVISIIRTPLMISKLRINGKDGNDKLPGNGNAGIGNRDVDHFLTSFRIVFVLCKSLLFCIYELELKKCERIREGDWSNDPDRNRKDRLPTGYREPVNGKTGPMNV